MDSAAQSAEPASRVLRRLLAEQAVSSRALAEATKEIRPPKGVSASYIRNVARGDDLPSAEALAILAEALHVQPEVFAEYRLAKVRELFDERAVGLEEALANLAAVPGLSRLLDPRMELVRETEAAARRLEQQRDSSAEDTPGPARRAQGR